MTHTRQSPPNPRYIHTRYMMDGCNLPAREKREIRIRKVRIKQN